MRSVEELTALNIPRSLMTWEEERAWVEYWFNKYESVGFVENFHLLRNKYEKRAGTPFTVIGRCTEEECDLECLPMWKIRFEDGTETCAFPEEICKLEIEKQER